MRKFITNVYECQATELFRGVTFHITEKSSQGEDEYFNLVLEALKTNKVSVINEGLYYKNSISFNETMNLEGITELMCLDEKESLNRLKRISLLTNLRKIYFNKTADYRLAQFNFRKFKNLREIIIETGNISETLASISSLL